MKRKYKIVFLVSFLCICQQSLGQKPKDINEAIEYFEKLWTSKEKTNFKDKQEREAVLELHFSVGMWIRNEWIRGRRDTLLLNQFNNLGILHPDDMSSIILTSLHRKLNNIPLDIEGQVEQYKSYWKPIIENNEKTRKLAVEIYEKKSIGDTVKIYMSVDTSNGQRNAVIIISPSSWAFDPKKDLLVIGLVTKKYFLNDSSNVFFSIQILSLNFENTKILMKEAVPNDIYDFHLDKLRIE